MEKKFYIIISLLICVALQPLSAKKNLDELMSKSSRGTEFWIAIPPNEIPNYILNQRMEIYVTSNVNTDVTLEYPADNYKVTKRVNALEITTFADPVSGRRNHENYHWEIYESETILRKGIHIYSEDSISVYVLNAKKMTSDGYLAIPVQSWGSDYIHLSYYDIYSVIGDFLPVRRKLGGGFVIAASKDNTNISIELKGKGKSAGATEGGRKIGENFNITLDEGETYMVVGNGETTNRFDLSGSRITSNKPIGLISFQQRTTVPSDISNNGYDHLVEMLPPVSSWGKRYNTVEFDRKGKGDFFRLIAGFDDTEWSVKNYDPETGQLIDEKKGTLQNSGDFFEFNNEFGWGSNNQSIRGISVWEADKPVLLMQYSYSAEWDNSENYDPFMLIVASREQYVNKTVFQTPDEEAGSEDHYLNLIAIGDTSDADHADLKSIAIDGRPVWLDEPDFLDNRIPDTDLYWAKLRTSAGAHKIEGDTRFGAYIYGFGNYDSYGWPAAMGFDILNQIDTLPPELVISEVCGNYTINTVDSTKGSVEDYPRQYDIGIRNIELLENENYEFNLLTSDTIPQYKPLNEFKFELIVIDPEKKARAVVKVSDIEGNYVMDTLSYDPDSSGFVTISLDYYDSGDSLTPGKVLPLELKISSEDWIDYELERFNLDIIYKSKWMIFEDSVEHEELSADNWSVDISDSATDEVFNKLSIEADGGEFVKEDRTLLKLYFLVLLSDEMNFSPVIENIDIALAAPCYHTDIKEVTLRVCAPELRPVISSPYDYSLRSIFPNPSAGETVEIEFSVGLDSHTKIELLNILGSRFETLIDRDTDPGIYSIPVELTDVPAGTYFLKMRSGHYVAVRKLVITK